MSYTPQQIESFVYDYKTKYEHGFLPDEVEDVRKHFGPLSDEKFDSALCGITCMMMEEKFVIYHCDIVKAVNCGVEDRDLTFEEFD